MNVPMSLLKPTRIWIFELTITLSESSESLDLRAAEQRTHKHLRYTTKNIAFSQAKNTQSKEHARLPTDLVWADVGFSINSVSLHRSVARLCVCSPKISTLLHRVRGREPFHVRQARQDRIHDGTDRVQGKGAHRRLWGEPGTAPPGQGIQEEAQEQVHVPLVVPLRGLVLLPGLHLRVHLLHLGLRRPVRRREDPQVDHVPPGVLLHVCPGHAAHQGISLSLTTFSCNRTATTSYRRQRADTVWVRFLPCDGPAFLFIQNSCLEMF